MTTLAATPGGTSDGAAMHSWTAAEKSLAEAVREGRVAEFSGETVRAEVVCSLACAEPGRSTLATPGVRLVGARIEGRLMFANGTVAAPIWLLRSEIPDGIDLAGACTRSIVLIGSRLYGEYAMVAEEATVEGSFILDGAMIHGVCRLARVSISGELSAKHARFEPSGPLAVDLQGSEVGAVSFDGSAILGQLSFSASTIRGQFSALGAEFRHPDSIAVDADS
jgi:hypothetical protein